MVKDFARLALLLAILLVPSALLADPVINFDSLTDLNSVTTQFSGLTFSNATALTAGISLNEFEFPPLSGSNVVFDDGGPMFIAFGNPIIGFSAYFTYSSPLILQGIDAGNNIVATATSVFSSNLALSGDLGSSSNEFLQLAYAPGISGIRITGDASGGSFTIDNVSYTTKATTASVPEPSSICLLLTGMAGLFGLRKRFI
jgi:hypothetical protein